jgi:hypothetical protein
MLSQYGCTPLQLAAACGNLEMVEDLLWPYELIINSDRVLLSNDFGYEYLNHRDMQVLHAAPAAAIAMACSVAMKSR